MKRTRKRIGNFIVCLGWNLARLETLSLFLKVIYPFLARDLCKKWAHGSLNQKNFLLMVLLSSKFFPVLTSFPVYCIEYLDDQPIDELVKDTAISTKRGLEKANEWLARLKAQDVMTVGDLRDLQEDDWQNL